jgi:GNAT superfamily N-acetyltransferase
MSDFPFADLALSQRLERAEALGNARFVEARARLSPDRGSGWIEVAGARAMYDGASAPTTQTFGLGLFQPATAENLDAIEAFYRERGAPVFHEVSPLADAGLPALLSGRGYRPVEFTSVLYRPIDAGTSVDGQTARKASAIGPDGVQTSSPAAVSVRRIESGEEEIYARVAAEGWNEFGVSDFVLEMGRLSGQVEGQRLFVAEIDGTPVAAGALALADGIAHLAGASTIPAGRRRGAQLALLDHRLRYAAGEGCDIALMGALPGSGSQRNAERHGFRIAYTRIKWGRHEQALGVRD